MSKKAFISQADMKRMAEIAKREGVIVEYEKDGIIVRVKPYEPFRDPEPQNTLPDDFAL